MSYESFYSRAGDYFGSCPVTGKRGYTTRKQARKARQAGVTGTATHTNADTANFGTSADTTTQKPVTNTGA